MAVVLITGCSSGFGLVTALHFARAGETVIAGVRRPLAATELQRRRDEEGLTFDIVGLDVTEEASVAAAVSGAVDVHGRIDVLVNNAGVGLQGAIEDTSPDVVRAAFETNVFGPLRLLRAVLPVMRRQGRGVVVNVSSLAGRVSAPFAGIYSATKFALEALSESLHYEVAPFGIRVAVIEPGTFPTALADKRLDPGTTGATGDGEASPYAPALRRWVEASARLPGRDVAGDPALVATAIYEAATRSDHPLRRLVGPDAELIGALRHDLDDSAFEQTVRRALDFWG